MGKPKAPKPQDPEKIASAQTGMNIGTSIANTQMGQVDQIGPDGSLTYEDNGTYKWKDPTSNKVYNLPKSTAVTSLSPENQAIWDQNKGAELGMAETANQQSSFLKEYLGEPWNPDTSEIEGRLDELARERMDPRFERERAATENRLVQQGATPGSQPWETAMGQFGEDKNDAYNQLMLQGRGQAFGELGAIRNQPINEISALLSGSQVNQPGYQAATPAKAATTDYAGISGMTHQQELAAYQAKLAANPWGSLFGAAGKIGAAMI